MPPIIITHLEEGSYRWRLQDEDVILAVNPPDPVLATVGELKASIDAFKAALTNYDVESGE